MRWNSWIGSHSTLAALALLTVASVDLANAQDASSATMSCAVTEQRSSSDAPALVFRGRVTDRDLIDGDTFWLGHTKIRLRGVDALEANQPCARDGQVVECAEESRRALLALMGSGEVRCEVQFARGGRPAMDRSRYLATCYNGETYINRALITEGWAFIHGPHNVEEYVTAEAEAVAARRGIHQYAVQRPADFRSERREVQNERRLQKQCIALGLTAPASTVTAQ